MTCGVPQGSLSLSLSTTEPGRIIETHRFAGSILLTVLTYIVLYIQTLHQPLLLFALFRSVVEM